MTDLAFGIKTPPTLLSRVEEPIDRATETVAIGTFRTSGDVR